jgi:Xaa-Pro aminopeptidase
MPTLDALQARRSRLLERLQKPVLLMAGGERSRNYPDNPYPYRPDSNFLYFFSHPEPGSAALFDPEDGKVTLFLNERSAANALWYGAVPAFDEMQKRHGVDAVLGTSTLQKSVRQIVGNRGVESIAVADPKATEVARTVTGQDLDFYDASKVATPELIQAIGQMRVLKGDEEIAEMRKTAEITKQAHVAAMAHTRPGVTEQELAGIVDGCFARHGCVPAYNSILSVRGEVLHNHAHDNTVQDGDVLLLDAGAENGNGYCSDITRCWPAKDFTPEAREIYDIVLQSEVAAIQMVKPGVRYRDIHMHASKVVAEGLVGMGLLKGDPDQLVEDGAHALFFPHGVGHLIGLDVHDMEAFGDAIAYPKGRTRSKQFGTAYLRLDMDLAPGMCFTIEPGIYFVPAILHGEEFRNQFKEQVDWEKAESFLKMNNGRGFGGIRIEDDVLCTEGGADVLTKSTPKEREEVQELVGSAY